MLPISRRRAARLIRRRCEAEPPVIEPDERIVFTRNIPDGPPVYRAEAWQAITAGRTLHDWGTHQQRLRRLGREGQEVASAPKLFSSQVRTRADAQTLLLFYFFYSPLICFQQ